MHSTPTWLRAVTCLVLVASAQAQCPDSLSLARPGTSAVSAGNYILVAGGSLGNGATNLVDLYDVTSGTWSTPNLSLSRGFCATTSVAGLAMVAGGGQSTAFGTLLVRDRVDLFDSASGVWSTATLSQARAYSAATSAGGHAVIAGGVLGGGPPLAPTAVVDIFDSGTGTWTTAQLSVARGFLSAAAAGNMALFAGGHDGTNAVDTVDIYNANSGLWSISQLSAPRLWMSATTLGSRVLFAGGATFNGVNWAQQDIVDVYDTATGLWSVEQLSAPRQQLAATTINGYAIFAGGFDAAGVSDVVDVYDGTRWFTLQLSQARYDLVAASTPAAALFAGGLVPLQGSNSPTATVDHFPSGFPVPYCFGDGASTPCPCGNSGGAGRGCANSTGGGARLTGAGCNSMTNDQVSLQADNLAPAQPALLFAALNRVNGGAGALFGDGLRCAGGAVRRLGIRAANANGDAAWGPGLATANGWSAGDQRRFQVWYRDPSGPCGSGFNLSNGVELSFAP